MQKMHPQSRPKMRQKLKDEIEQQIHRPQLQKPLLHWIVRANRDHSMRLTADGPKELNEDPRQRGTREQTRLQQNRPPKQLDGLHGDAPIKE